MFFKHQQFGVVEQIRALQIDIDDYISGFMGGNPDSVSFFCEIYYHQLETCYDAYQAMDEGFYKEKAKELLMNILHTDTNFSISELRVYSCFSGYNPDETRQDIMSFASEYRTQTSGYCSAVL